MNFLLSQLNQSVNFFFNKNNRKSLKMLTLNHETNISRYFVWIDLPQILYTMTNVSIDKDQDVHKPVENFVYKSVHAFLIVHLKFVFENL